MARSRSVGGAERKGKVGQGRLALHNGFALLQLVLQHKAGGILGGWKGVGGQVSSPFTELQLSRDFNW